MKYPKWDEYNDAKKYKAVKKELELETRNATTKADLLNMVEFLFDCMDESLRGDFEDELMREAKHGED